MSQVNASVIAGESQDTQIQDCLINFFISFLYSSVKTQEFWQIQCLEAKSAKGLYNITAKISVNEVI